MPFAGSSWHAYGTESFKPPESLLGENHKLFLLRHRPISDSI
jgi:hypothetical protein